jgi:hypothetical protein
VKKLKLWIDDVRPAPHGFTEIHSVNEAKVIIEALDCAFAMSSELGFYDEAKNFKIEVIDIDHDAGDFAYDGGDYIKLLDWLEMTEKNYPIHIHSMNPVGAANMRAIIQKNGWEEV